MLKKERVERSLITMNMFGVVYKVESHISSVNRYGQEFESNRTKVKSAEILDKNCLFTPPSLFPHIYEIDPKSTSHFFRCHSFLRFRFHRF